ncbi:MAG TPA: hypothetical protein VNS09_24060 [Solirubrobacter sp.]|nr:hypothetical protein [Solirubrobacter sp.]
MRSSLVAVFALLALPSGASAQVPLDYAAPTASTARGAPLTFAIRTPAAAGTVVVRVSGSDAVGPDGLLTGATGTWLDETATPALDGLQVWRVPADSVLRRRPGHYYWQAYLTGGDVVGPVQELSVRLPYADRGRGKLYPKFGQRGVRQFHLSSAAFPAEVSRERFRALARTTATRWSLKTLRWTSAPAGVQDGVSVAGFSTAVARDVLGVQTDYVRDGRVVESDLALNAREHWAEGPDYPALDQVDLESVLLHELGHMAGNKKHRAQCANSPLMEALGAGEWWRGPRDKWFGSCDGVAAAASVRPARRLVRRVVRL